MKLTRNHVLFEGPRQSKSLGIVLQRPCCQKQGR